MDIGQPLPDFYLRNTCKFTAKSVMVRRVVPRRLLCSTPDRLLHHSRALKKPQRHPEITAFAQRRGTTSDHWRLRASPLLAARSSATVSRAQHGQSGSARLAEVCGLSSSLRQDQRVSRPAVYGLPAGPRPHPMGVGRRTVTRGQAGAGRRWRGCHGKGGLRWPILLHYRRKRDNKRSVSDNFVSIPGAYSLI
jgi:hypothetical protein